MSRLATALVGAGLVTMAVLGWFGAAVAGPSGVAVVSAAVFVVAAAVARCALAPPVRRADRGGRSHASAAPNASFPTFVEFTSAIYSGKASRRHFDRRLRPMLWRLASAAATDRTADAAEVSDRIREHFGNDLWSLLDPARPAWEDPAGVSAAGPDIPTLSRLVAGIERIDRP